MVVAPAHRLLAAVLHAAPALLPAQGVAVPTAYTSISWDEKDGLPSPEVLSITQDLDGFLWVGTTGGLARFDGLRFVVPLGAESFMAERVHALCVSPDGTLWVALEDRVASLREPGAAAYSAQHGMPMGSILALHCSRDGTVWAGGHGGVSQFVDGAWRQLELTPTPQPTVEAIVEDSSGILWLGTSEGAFRADAAGAFASHDRALPVRAIAEAADRSMWATDRAAGVRPLSASSRTPVYGGEIINGLRLLSDRRGNFWVGTLGHGLLRLGGSPPALRDRFTAPHTLSGNIVRSLFEDRHGNLWVGTQLGLTRLSQAMIVPAPIERTAGGEVTRALLADPAGGMWVGTDGGLTRIAEGGVTTYGLEDGLPSRVITVLHRDERGTIWIGTDRGLARWRAGRIAIVAMPGRPAPGRIAAIATDPEGAVWICDFDKGLFRLADRRLERFPSAPLLLKPASAAITDSHGRIWIGFRSGTVAVHHHGAFTFYTAADGLAGGMITGLLEDRDGTVWLASTRGLTRFRNGVFTALRQGRELPGGRLMALLEDDAGSFWLGTDSGLARIARANLEQAFASGTRPVHDLYDRSDGLAANLTLMGYPNAMRGRDGTLWFTTAAGAVTVLPGQLRRRDRLLVTVDDVVVNGRAVAPAATLALPPAISQLQFEYSALALQRPEAVRFRYKLEGLDPEWVDNGRIRRVSYASVPPGSYRFRVRASDGSTDSETDLRLVIRPAYHQTCWFRGSALATSGLLLMVAWRSRVRRMRHDLALVEDERTRVSREIHDTLLQSLVGTALHLDNISDELGPTRPAIATRLARTRRQLERHIDDAHQAIFELRTHRGDQPDLAASLRTLCASEGSDLDVEVRFEATGHPPPCPAAVQHQVLRIAGEAITNAKRHAHARRVTVALAYQEDESALQLRVADDGVGFDAGGTATEPGAHFGLAIVRERAQQIRARLQIVSAPGHGTTLLLSVVLKAR